MKTLHRVSLRKLGPHPPGGRSGGGGMRLKDAKYLVGCKGTESRNVAVCVCLSLVWIECQLLAFTVRQGDKPNTKFELQIRISYSRGYQIMGHKPAGHLQVLKNYVKLVVSTHNFGKSLRFNMIFQYPVQHFREYFVSTGTFHSLL
jgi:hypothetical protein